MSPQKAKQARDAALALHPKVELVDNWHTGWVNVLALVERTGGHKSLHIDADGWLSARHNLFVVFVGNVPHAYLCFSVQPLVASDGVAHEEDGKVAVEAVVECFAVDEKQKSKGLKSLLVEHAKARATQLRCQSFRMEI